MVIRKATLADLKEITAIYDEIHEQEDQRLTVTGWIRNVYPTMETAKESIIQGDMFVAVGEVIFAAATINQKQGDAYTKAFWKYKVSEAEVMVLHTLVVSPKAKGRGIGKSVIAFYEKYAVEHQCCYLRMDTNVKNTAARSLYKKLGYHEVGIVPCDFNGIEGVQLVCLEKKLNSCLHGKC